MSNRKEELRRIARKQRTQLSEEYRKQADLVIAEKFLAFLSTLSDIKLVGLYWANEHEVDTHGLLEDLYRNNFLCALPVINEKGMYFSDWTPTTIMRPNNVMRFVEPIGATEVSPDLIVVPLLTCDMQGHRLGSGKGWYDKYLASHKAIKVGLCYSKMLSKTLPNEQHDISLDIVITETGSY